MELTLKVDRKVSALFFLSVIIVIGVQIVLAQVPPNPGHPPSQIGPGTFLGGSGDTWVFPGTVQANAFVGAVPTGAIMAFNLSSCPSGWTLADGTANTPDLRGMFIRGLDDGLAGNDPDAPRTLGSIQDDEFEEHTHGGRTMNPSQGWCPNGGCGDYGSVNTMASVGGTETRPKNIALIYCVKS